MVFCVELAGDLAGRQPGRFVADQQAEHIEAGSLRQRTKRRDSRIVFHISSIVDIYGNAMIVRLSEGQVLSSHTWQRIPRRFAPAIFQRYRDGLQRLAAIRTRSSGS
jgi:hypothetical protein